MSKTDLDKHILLSLLLLNPVITFLLSKSVLLSFICLLVALVLIVITAKSKKIIYLFTINFILLISLFLHSEVVFKFGFPEYIITNLYEIEDGYYFNKPELLEDIRDKEYEVFYKTNVEGYRMPSALSADKTVEKCDWLFVGDSFTQGAQVEFRNLYTSQLYNQFPDKVIVNAGISGFGIIEEYNYYKNAGYKLKPQKVFLQICSFNDFMNVKENNHDFSDYLTQYSELARFLLFNLKYKSPEELSLGRWVEPFCKQEEDNRDYNIFYTDKSEKQLQDLKKFAKYLALFKQEVEKNGSELVVLLIPTKEQSYSRYLDEVTSGFEIPSSKLDMLYPNNFLKKLCDQNGVELIDLLDAYKENAENVFFEYDEHLNEFGHYLTAEVLKEKISRTSISKSTLLSNTLLGDRYPTLIDNDERLLYQSYRDGNNEIFLNDSKMKNETRLTHNNIDESHPTVNLSKNIVALTEGSAEDLTTNIALLDLETMERTYQTLESNTFGAIPNFSPDGNSITYAEWNWDEREQNFTTPRIVISPLESSESKNVLTDGKHEDWRPIFTSDGKSIIFISKRSEQFDLFIKEISSGTERQLTNTPYDEWDPQISQDGKSIVYAGKKDGNWDLFILDIESGQPYRITETIGDEWDPSFSSKGEKVVFSGEFGFHHCIYQLIL